MPPQKVHYWTKLFLLLSLIGSTAGRGGGGLDEFINSFPPGMDYLLLCIKVDFFKSNKLLCIVFSPTMTGTFVRLPERSEVFADIHENLIVEFYSR